MNIQATLTISRKDDGSLTATIKDLKEGEKAVEGISKKLESFQVPTTFADLRTEIGGLVKEFLSLSPALAALAGGAALAAAAIAAVAAAVVALAVAAVSEIADFSAEMVKLQQVTDVNVETLQRWAAAAASSGGSVEAITNAVVKMQQSIAQGDDTFERLGLSLEHLRDLKPEEQFEEIGRAILAIRDPVLQQQAALEVFGERGKEVLAQLRAGFLDTAEAAKDVIPEETILAAKALQDQFEAIGQIVDYLTRTLGGFLVQTGLGQAAFLALLIVLGLGLQILQKLSNWFIDASAAGAKLLVVAENLGSIMGKLWLAVTSPSQAVAVFADVANQIEVLKARFLEIDEVAGDQKIKIASVFEGIGDGIGAIAARALGMVKTVQTATDPGFVSKAASDQLKKLGEEARKLGADLQQALGQAQAESLGGGLRSAFASIAVDAEQQFGKIAELVKKGLDPASAEALRDKVFALTMQLEDNAVAAERQRVLGETFDDVRERAADLLSVISEFEKRGGGIASVTDDALVSLQAQTEQTIQALESAGINTDELKARLAEMNVTLKERGVLTAKEAAVFDANLAAQQRYWDEEDRRLEESKLNWSELFDFIGGLGDILSGLGVDADSLFGKLAGGAGGLADLFKPFADAGASIGDTFKGIGSALTGKQGLMGFLSGAQIAVQAFGIIKGIIGAFSKPEHVKAMEQVGQNWGVAISESLGKKIVEDSKKFGIAKELAALLNLTDIVAESGKGIDEFGEQINSLMEAVASGTVPAKEGIEELGSVFDQAKEDAAAAGKTFNKTMIDMIRRAAELNIEIPEVTAHLAEMSVLAAAGAKKIAAGFAQIDPERVTGPFGEAAARSFAFGFQAALAEEGLLGAIESMGEDLLAFNEVLLASGNTAAAAILAPFVQLAQVINDEANPSLRGFLEVLAGATDVFNAMAGSGVLNTQALTDFGVVIGATFDELVASGLNEVQALQAIAPQLALAKQAAEDYGLTLDENTQELIRQAEAAGLAFPEDAANRTADAMERLVDIMSQVYGITGRTSAEMAELANNANRAAAASQNIDPGAGGGGGGGEGPTGPGPTGAQRGYEGIIPDLGGGLGPLIQPHAGEYASIIPAAEVRRGGVPERGGGGTVNNMSVEIQINGSGLSQNELRDATAAAMNDVYRGNFGNVVTRQEQARRKRGRRQ